MERKILLLVTILLFSVRLLAQNDSQQITKQLPESNKVELNPQKVYYKVNRGTSTNFKEVCLKLNDNGGLIVYHSHDYSFAVVDPLKMSFSELSQFFDKNSNCKMEIFPTTPQTFNSIEDIKLFKSKLDSCKKKLAML